jgi:two-component system chemotaxis response regulator CheY
MNKKILVVDDSESVREIVRDTLEKAGYQVQTAPDGKDALELLPAEAFQMVVTDLYMPQVDGLTLIREIRKMEEYQFTPILFLTTESHLDKKKQAKDAGATGWIVKPFEPEKLIRAVKKVLR